MPNPNVNDMIVKQASAILADVVQKVNEGG